MVHSPRSWVWAGRRRAGLLMEVVWTEAWQQEQAHSGGRGLGGSCADWDQKHGGQGGWWWGREEGGEGRRRPHWGVSTFWIVDEYQLPRKYIQGLEKVPKPGKKKWQTLVSCGRSSGNPSSGLVIYMSILSFCELKKYIILYQNKFLFSSKFDSPSCFLHLASDVVLSFQVRSRLKWTLEAVMECLFHSCVFYQFNVSSAFKAK